MFSTFAGLGSFISCQRPVVVTLKEVNGINRIEDFIKACTLRGWIVNRIDVQNQLDIYATSQEEIQLE